MSVGGGYEVSGSNWVTLSSNWEEYTVIIDPTQHQASDTHYSDGDFQKIQESYSETEQSMTKITNPLESSILIDEFACMEKVPNRKRGM